MESTKQCNPRTRRGNESIQEKKGMQTNNPNCPNNKVQLQPTKSKENPTLSAKEHHHSQSSQHTNAKTN
jgi:hypothetical protein